MPAGIESWLPLFFSGTTGLADYLPAHTVIVDLVDLERALEGYWAEIEARFEERRHDRERPLLPPAVAFVPAADVMTALASHPRIALTPVKVEPIAATVPLRNFGSGPPPELRADTRAPKPLEKLGRFLDGFKGRVLLTSDSAGRREVLIDMLRRQGLPVDVAPDLPSFVEGDARLGLAVAPDVRGLSLPGLRARRRGAALR